MQPMQTFKLALVSDLTPDGSEVIPAAELQGVSAAIQSQLNTDVGPQWGLSVTIDPFNILNEVPLDYWPILVCKDIGDPDIEGVHKDPDHHPYALVTYDEYWSLTASHEAIEMVIAPEGNRQLFTAPPGSNDPSVEKVAYLIEPCDPVYSAEYGYPINGWLMSNFCYPSYYTLAGLPPYDKQGQLTAPRTLSPGGYVCYQDGAGDWIRWSMFDGNYDTTNFGKTPVMTSERSSLRSWLDKKNF